MSEPPAGSVRSTSPRGLVGPFTGRQIAVALFVAYSAGLGIPFLALALALEEAPRIVRPLRRHARLVEVLGGSLVVLIGVSLIFDWLAWFSQHLSFLSPSV